MNLHEYQAKALFAEYGLPVPHGIVIRSLEEALLAVTQLKTNQWVVKAQVHAGGRGKAGGVKLVSNKDELNGVIKNLLHTRLITQQTNHLGQPINELLIEETSEIQKEMYLGVVIDRSSQKIVIMASTEGGVDIEKVARETPEKIIKIMIDPAIGVSPYQAREIAFGLGLQNDQIKQFTDIVLKLYQLFLEKDLSLVEINPLVITQSLALICLDAKVNIDENALFRQTALRAIRDTSQEDEREIKARNWELNYISLEGDIGCMVNGAGLAMATMDLIKLHGGSPANFLDVGGGATKERVKEAFKIILSDGQVKGILVNIFGGIVRCDLIAEGIIQAITEVGIKVPVVVRLEGNKALEASELLNRSGLNIIAATSLKNAAEAIVKAVGENR